MKPHAILAATLLFAGCATEFSVPVTGAIGKEPAQGTATARMSGDGAFWVATTRGLRCEGSYDSKSRDPTITAPVTCNDGRTGNLIITRTLDGVSGTVIGRLSDGTESRFVFGNLSFDQAFGGSGSQTVLIQ